MCRKRRVYAHNTGCKGKQKSMGKRNRIFKIFLTILYHVCHSVFRKSGGKYRLGRKIRKLSTVSTELCTDRMEKYAKRAISSGLCAKIEQKYGRKGRCGKGEVLTHILWITVCKEWKTPFFTGNKGVPESVGALWKTDGKNDGWRWNKVEIFLFLQLFCPSVKDLSTA